MTNTGVGIIECDFFPVSIVAVVGDFVAEAIWPTLVEAHGGNPTPISFEDLKRKQQEIEDRVARGHHWPYGQHLGRNNCTLLWVGDVNDKSTIAHEGFHAAYYLLDHLGIPLSVESNEVYAYMLTWIFEGVQKGIDSIQDEQLTPERTILL